MRPIVALAIAIFAAFFMPWLNISPGEPHFVSGLEMAMKAGDLNSTLEHAGVARPGGINVAIWFWVLPALAVITILTEGKGLGGRLMGVLTGAYPLGWLTYGIIRAIHSGPAKPERPSHVDVSNALGVGMYVLLLASLLVLVFGLAGVGASEEGE